MRKIFPLINIKEIEQLLITHAKTKITGQILVINKYHEKTIQIFMNTAFKKKDTNICNW